MGRGQRAHLGRCKPLYCGRRNRVNLAGTQLCDIFGVDPTDMRAREGADLIGSETCNL